MLKRKDLKIEYLKGTGPGGQNKNKLETACRITHAPSGVTSYADCRTQRQSYKTACKGLEDKLRNLEASRRAASKKASRDHKIKNMRTIRTYNFKTQTVKDHRSKKTASLDKVMNKGQLGLLR